MEIVEKFPNNKAISDDSGRTLTYIELSELIKSYFNQIETIPNSCGIIYLPKCIETIALQLALNSKNMIFLVLEYGQDIRLKEAIEQVQPSHVFKVKDFQNITLKFKKFKKYQEDLRYTVFSSGSTGKPKQIHMKDKPIISVVTQQAEIISFNENKSFLWLLNSAFDASLSDIYLTLFSGGHLVVTNKKPNQIKSCFNLIKQHKITHTDIPPIVFSFWLQELQKNNTTLEHIVFGGELANEKLVRDMLNYVSLYNAYGPTETTICSSMIKTDPSWSYQNVGKPLNGVFYKIIDNELHIGGEHCSIGYSEEILNSKFYIENEIKWFKTGDNFKKDNENYFYLGRIDRQFKLNGQLICPEEIEFNAKKFGAENAQLRLEENKLHLYYTGDLNISSFKKNIVSWMHPHFYHPITISNNINQNWKFQIK